MPISPCSMPILDCCAPIDDCFPPISACCAPTFGDDGAVPHDPILIADAEPDQVFALGALLFGEADVAQVAAHRVRTAVGDDVRGFVVRADVEAAPVAGLPCLK